MGELTNMVQRMSCEQPKQYSTNYNHNGAKSQGPSRLSVICHNCNSQGHIMKYYNWNGRGNDDEKQLLFTLFTDFLSGACLRFLAPEFNFLKNRAWCPSGVFVFVLVCTP
jgi:hypothetical protein